MANDTISAVLLAIITFFVPPAGVFILAGCGADFFINICLTLLGVFPGHIHGYYVMYVYYRRRDEQRMGVYDSKPVPGVYSGNVQTGGRGYGTIAQTA